jgi:hypothetical protein
MPLQDEWYNFLNSKFFGFLLCFCLTVVLSIRLSHFDIEGMYMITKKSISILLTGIFVGILRAGSVPANTDSVPANTDAEKIAASNIEIANAIKLFAARQAATAAEAAKAAMSCERYFADREEAEYESLMEKYATWCSDTSTNKNSARYCVDLFLLLDEKSHTIRTNSGSKRIPIAHRRFSKANKQWNMVV